MKNLFLLTLSILLLQPFSTKAANLFDVNFHATCRSTNELGDIVSSRIGNADLIQSCADANEIADVSTLALVYDADQDDLKVVRISDGVAICESFAFSDGISIYNKRGTVRERQAFISQNESLVGSFVGTEWALRGGNGTLLKLNLRAKFQIGIPAQGGAQAKLYTGIFSTKGRLGGTNPTPQ